jgi:hypothetical protein
MMPLTGVKAYGWEWANDYGMGMAQAAAKMAGQGLNWALVQNLIDPLPGSAVEQVPPKGAYDDAAWVDALRQEGLRVYQSTAVTFSPAAFADPSVRPIDQHGQEFEPFTWYYGICPTATRYIDAKVQRFADAVGTTEPDGVFLSFLRFPAFWELWLPGVSRKDILEYCFCERCLAAFSSDTGIDLPAARAAGLLTGELRFEWTRWKCQYVARLALRLRQVAQESCPGVDVILNSFGLGTTDFSNAVEEVLGQRFSDLDEAIDSYELMFYFQICKRDPSVWIPQRLAQARQQTSRRLFACLQGGPEYLEDVYAPQGRRREITAEEWRAALRAAALAQADGVLVYSWRDLLRDDLEGGSRVSDLRAYGDGLL